MTTTSNNQEGVEIPEREVPMASSENQASPNHEEFVKSADPFEIREAKTLIWSNVSMTIVR